MEIRALTVFSLLLVAFGVCKGLIVVGEDKRPPGLIPFQRVGHAPSSSSASMSWLQSFPSFFQSVEQQDSSTADFDTAAGLDDGADLLAVRFSRGLFAPRLGRRKRSPSSSDNPTITSGAAADDDVISSGESRHVRAASPLIPRYLYDADGNQVDVRNLLLQRRSPWAIITYKDGMEKKMAFNPRLGRAMVPRLGRKRSSDSSSSSTASDQDVIDVDQELGVDEKRAMAFSPRLGRGGGSTQARGGLAFSPRLGRSNGGENADQQSGV